MGLSLIYLFVGLAGGAETRFELLDEPKDQTLLLLACAITERTFEALFGFGSVFLGNFLGLHNLLLSKRNPAMNFGSSTGALPLCEELSIFLRQQLDAVAGF